MCLSRLRQSEGALYNVTFSVYYYCKFTLFAFSFSSSNQIFSTRSRVAGSALPIQNVQFLSVEHTPILGVFAAAVAE